MRKIATVVAALMLPVQAHALGVGEIEWNSALNQPLEAEIGLFSLGSVSENDIRVKLAPYEAYEQAGIEYPSILRNLKFSVERRTSGDSYIKLDSQDAIKEPFLDILVEIDWPSGHLMREFTVLLDLPVMTDKVTGPVSAPVVSAPEPATVPADTVGDSDQPTATTQVFGETAPQPASNDLRVGMVKRGDTLWGIAESMRTDNSVSVQQVMMALLKNNPDAFYNSNINNLKAGYVLRLDNRNLITEVSKTEAAREAQRQYQSWLEDKGRGNTAVTKTGAGQDAAIGAGAGQNAGGSSLRLVAPGEADVGIPKVAGGDGQADIANMDLETLRQELNYALQSSDVGRQENEQLRTRIAELEEQIGKMQRLLSLRDDALSVLQTNPQAQEQLQTATPDTTDAAVTPERVATEPAQQQDEVVADAEAVAPATAAAQQQSKAASKQKPAQVNEEGFIDTAMGYIKRTVSAASSIMNPLALGGIVSGVLLLIGGAWFLRKRKISAEDLEQSMMVEVADKQLSEDLANGTISDLEQKEETSAVELLDSTGSENFEADIDEIDVLAEADVYLAYQRFDRAEELMREAVNNEPQRLDLRFKLLEVFAASGNRDGFIETAEAIKAKGGQEDVSLWDKVVAMGSKIAADHPLFGASDSAQVVSDSSSSSAATSSDNFEAEIPGGDLEADFAGLDDDLMLDLDAHIAAESAETEASDNNDAISEQTDDGMAATSVDLDISADDEIQDVSFSEDSMAEAGSDASESVADALGENDNPLEFNLDELSASDNEEVAADESDQVTAEDVFVPDNEIEFEALSTADEQATDDQADDAVISDATAAVSDDDSLDFELGETEPDLDTEQVVADAGEPAEAETLNIDETFAFESSPETESDAVTAIDAGDQPSETTELEETISADNAFNFDSVDTEAGAIDDELSDDIDWLTGVADDAADEDADTFFSSEDEVATKLDLIRAYIDMGDKESARNILTEVVEEGNDDQKQEAEELLRQIG